MDVGGKLFSAIFVGTFVILQLFLLIPGTEVILLCSGDQKLQ
jgi:hypothetical protein